MSSRLRLVALGASAVALLAAAWWLSGIWSPTPPRSLTMATGPEGSACAVIAERYRETLARAGVDLRLRETAGSVANLALLRDPESGVSVGFLQAGTPGASDAADLVSLGTVLYEPLWLFHRAVGGELAPADLKGKRLAIGPEGSGTRTLSLRLLALLDIDERSAELLPLSPEEAADALIRGEIDLAATVTSWEAPVVRRLITTPGIALASFPRADALIARNPFLNKVTLPAGVADLALDIPPANVTLIAPKASLVVRSELHSALQYLLLDAASELHSRQGLFNRAGEFPAAETTDVPLAEGARQFYKTGRPFLQRHLPFWLAALAERLLLVLVPLVGVIYPLASVLPGLYVWNVRRRIFRLYADLKLIEFEAEALPAGADMRALTSRLDALEARATKLKVPKFQASLAYTLRHHVRLVRDRIERRS